MRACLAVLTILYALMLMPLWLFIGFVDGVGGFEENLQVPGQHVANAILLAAPVVLVAAPILAWSAFGLRCKRSAMAVILLPLPVVAALFLPWRSLLPA